jgi:hypothetical protein
MVDLGSSSCVALVRFPFGGINPRLAFEMGISHVLTQKVRTYDDHARKKTCKKDLVGSH